MAYEKHNFASGDILMAQDLNDMDDQIASNESGINAVTSGLVKVSDSEPQETVNRVWIKETPEAETLVPTYDEFIEVKSALTNVWEAIDLTNGDDNAKVFEYEIKAGTKYLFTNKVGDSTMGVRTCTSDGTAIEVVKTGIALNETVSFVASLDASYIRLYCNLANSIVTVQTAGSELVDVQEDVQDNAENIDDLKKKYNEKTSYYGKSWIPYRLPASFGMSIDFDILSDGYHYKPLINLNNLKNTGGNTLYASATAGVSGTGTRKKPYTFDTAYSNASSGDTIVMLEGDYDRNTFSANTIKKSINIIGEGNVRIFAGMFPSFSLETGYLHTYKATLNQGVKVFEINDDGSIAMLTPVNSVASVEATEGSYYRDNSVSPYAFYAHPYKNTDLFVCQSVPTEDIFSISNEDNSVKVYIENITIIGKPRAITVEKASSLNTLKATYNKVNFVYCGGTNYNTLSVYGGDVTLLDCVISGSFRDGFNYNGTDGDGTNLRDTYITEIGCKAFDCGLLQSENSMNGSTAHKNAKVLRINGCYHDNLGANCADVQENTQSVNLGCIAYNSVATTNGYNQGFSAQQSGAEMWCENCMAIGSVTDFFAASGATMHMEKCSYAVKQEGLSDNSPVPVAEWLLRNKVELG